MAFIYIKEKKKQQYLIFIFLAILLITAIILGWGFLKKEKPALPVSALPRPALKINFEILESQALKDLQPFVLIAPFEGTAGRINPFLVY